MNDEQNRFERARKPLAEDCQTKWSRNNAARAKRNADTSEVDARIKRNAEQRASWAGNDRAGGVRTISGVALDNVTARLKSAAEADRKPKAPSAIQTPPSAMTIAAIILEWERQNSDSYYRSEFNAENMKNFLLTNIAAGKLDFSYESLDVSFRWLSENNFLESAPRPRRRGDYSSKSAPKVFPAFLSDAERSAQMDRQQIESTQRMSKEIEKALATPFTALQKSVRASLPRYGAEAAR